MKRLIVIILIIYCFYSFYHNQMHLSMQNTNADLPSPNNGFQRVVFNSSSSFPYKFESTIPIQTNINDKKAIVQHTVSPDRYIPPPPLAQFIKPIPKDQPLIKSQNTIENNINKIPFIPQQPNVTPDRYIPPPTASFVPKQNPSTSLHLQQIPRPKNMTEFNPIIQNINSSLYNQIDLDIDKGKSFFGSLYNFCGLPLIHFACNVDIASLPPKYNFDNIKDLSNVAKFNLEGYKKNPTNKTEQNFKQANLNLTSCLNDLSINTQNQLHSLLGAQMENIAQNIANTLKIDDIVKTIIYDFVKVGSINEKLGIRPDPWANRCI
jgi:hypothetical protein